MKTLEEAFKAFADDSAPFVNETQRHAMEVSYYFGAAYVYGYFMAARKMNDPAGELHKLFNELDFYIQSLPYSDREGNA